MHAKPAGMRTHAGMRLWTSAGVSSSGRSVSQSMPNLLECAHTQACACGPVQGSAAVAGVSANACQMSWNAHTCRLRL